LCISDGMTFAQQFQKGNCIGFHDLKFVLNSGVTEDQLVSFIMNKYIPAAEETHPGSKVYFLRGIRGVCVDCYSMILFFPSNEERNKYWKDDGSVTELGAKAREKMKPVEDEFEKLCKTTDTYTDWMIQ
jgi:hypothetical protein